MTKEPSNDDSAHLGTQPTQDMPPQDQTVLVDIPKQMGGYRLTSLLGRGGMGEVWLAFDTQLERDVAVKLMRKELLANEDALRRFTREARAVARLNHPNIVHVYAFGDENGLTYFVMELVDGETVSQYMKRVRKIPLNDALPIVLQAIEGLSYANARGIIHRDIKPSNLMLTGDARVKIADFGLAKMIEHDTQMTAAGTAMGSPNYMSPEQARGEEADHRSDIYALGVSLYQMLTGELPFTAQSPVSVLLKQIQEPLPEPEYLKVLNDGDVLAVLKRMTDKDPARRYQNYGDLSNDLAALTPDIKFKGAHLPTASMPAATPSPTPGVVPASQEETAYGTSDETEPPTAIVSSRSLETPVGTAPGRATRSFLPFFVALIGILLLGTALAVWWIMDRRTSASENGAGIHSDVVSDSSPPASATTPQPTQTPPPAPSPSPVAGQTTVITTTHSTSGGAQPIDISVIITPRPTQIPGLAVNVTPPPAIADLLPGAPRQFVLTNENEADTTAITLHNAAGEVIGNLPPGTVVEQIRFVANLHGQSWQVIRYDNGEAFVKSEQVRPATAPE